MKLAVVIPTLNEADHLEAALRSIPAGAEIAISDGGSTDATPSIARAAGARVVTGSRGRAVQLNRGAAAVSGDVLLFLHADCTLPPDALDALELALSKPDVVGGSFRLRVAGAGFALRVVVMGSNARARYLRRPYGDQALFVRRSAFEEAGGFPELAIMEDLAFVRELRGRGRLVQAAATVTTDARHWQRLGTAATTLLNLSVALAFCLGVPASRLAPLYRRLRGESTMMRAKPVAQRR